MNRKETAEEAVIIKETLGGAVIGALGNVDLAGREIMRRMFEENDEDCHKKVDINGWRDWKGRIGLLDKFERMLEIEAAEKETVEMPDAELENEETPEIVEEDVVTEKAVTGEEGAKCKECEFTVDLMKRLIEQMEERHESLCCNECKIPAELMEKLVFI